LHKKFVGLKGVCIFAPANGETLVMKFASSLTKCKYKVKK